MPRELAKRLKALVPRVHGQDETDPWFLTCQLMLGATYSLVRAATLLNLREHSSLSEQTRFLLQALAERAPPPEDEFPTWSLGYYLNSAELRVQAAFHRLLGAYTGQEGWAFELARTVLDEGLGDEVAGILRAFLEDVPRPTDSSSALRRLWARANALKHREDHNLSELWLFAPRFSDSRVAALEVIQLTDILGTYRGKIDAA